MAGVEGLTASRIFNAIARCGLKENAVVFRIVEIKLSHKLARKVALVTGAGRGIGRAAEPSGRVGLAASSYCLVGRHRLSTNNGNCRFQPRFRRLLP